MVPYRKHYGTQHMLIHLPEEHRANLDQDKIIGTILLDLRRAFDCTPQELLIAELSTYGFDRKALKLIYSYLKGRKQPVCINNIYSNFLQLLSGIPHGSLFGALLFNIFLNDLFLLLTRASLHDYTDENTLSASSRNIASLMKLRLNTIKQIK